MPARSSRPSRAPPYDLVFGDAFNDFQIPYHLTTREFAQKIRNLLKPDGLYLALIDRMRGAGSWPPWSGLCRRYSPTSTWSRTSPGRWRPAQTYVVAASATPLDPERLRTVRGQGPDGEAAVRIMPRDAMEDWLRGRIRS